MHALFLAALRNDPARWPESLPAEHGDRFVDAARQHGVAPYLAHLWNGNPRWRARSPDVLAALRAEARRQAAFELARGREIRTVLAEFRARGIDSLLFKGAAIAHTHYPHPRLRPRADTDVLVRDEDYDLVATVLTDGAYRHDGGMRGKLITYQDTYRRTGPAGAVHAWDVHRRVFNPQAMAERFAFASLRRRAVPVHALGPAAFAPAPADALLLACVHRVAHHHERDRLIWLADIHLLATGMTNNGWDHVIDTARQLHLAALCRDGLDRAAYWFGRAAPRAARAALNDLAAHEQPEAPLVALRAGTRPGPRFYYDLAALPRWRDRLLLLREHTFPDTAYMLRRYGGRTRAVLPLLYLYRAYRGGRRMLGREGTPPPLPESVPSRNRQTHRR